MRKPWQHFTISKYLNKLNIYISGSNIPDLLTNCLFKLFEYIFRFGLGQPVFYFIIDT